MRGTNGNRRRVMTLMLAAVCCGAMLAACGSSKGNAQSGPAFADGVKFSGCMRSHGVPNFPDPTSGGGGGVHIPSGSGIDPQSPAFQSAQRACADLIPGPRRHGQASESRKLEMLGLARCMRRHGISTFPDPTANPPSAPPTGGGIAFGSPGSFISVPMTMIQSPGFSQAAAKCGFPGVGRPPKSAPAG